MKKKITLVISILVFLFAVYATANAAEPRITTVVPELTFSGTTAYCEALITDPGKTIYATMELWDGNTRVALWSGSGVSSLSLERSCRVTKGATYRLTVSGTINNVPFTSVEITGTC